MEKSNLLNTIMQYSQVIWDWNGTLLDDVDCCYETIQELLRRNGMPSLTKDQYLMKFRFPVVEYYKDIGFDFSRSSFDALSQQWIKIYEDNLIGCGVFPGMKELVLRLKNFGISSSILTAAFEKDVFNLIEAHGLNGIFKNIYGQNNYHAVSKLERGYELIAKMKSDGGTPIVLIGDTDHDAEVALALGVDSILLDGGHQKGRSYESLHEKFSNEGLKLMLMSRERDFNCGYDLSCSSNLILTDLS